MAPTVESSGSQTATLTTWHTLASYGTAKTRVLVVDLSALANGETVDLSIKSKARPIDGTEAVAYQASYSHMQAEPLVYSVPVPIGTTATFSLRQTGGTGRAFPWAVYYLDPDDVFDGRVTALEGNTASLSDFGWLPASIGLDKLVVGRLYAPGGSVTAGAGAGAEEYFRGSIFFCPNTQAIDQLSCNVTTGAASGLVRMGIYRVADGVLTSRLLDTGTVDASTTGQKDVTVSFTLTRGWYAIGATRNNAAIALRVFTGVMQNLGNSSGMIVSQPSDGYQVSMPGGTAGGLSSTAGTTIPMPDTNYRYVVAFRTA